MPTVALAQGPSAEPTCECETQCNARGSVNTDCEICGAELTGCEGIEVPEVITTTPSLTLQGEPRASEEYSEEDISAMNKIIEDHTELELTEFGADAEEPPEDWEEVVEWSDIKPKRIIKLKLKNSGIKDKLDVSSLTNLTELNCSNNPQLLELDVSNNKVLAVLHCNDTKLSELDVSYNVDLRELHCNNTQLSELNVGNNDALMALYCNNTQLSKLDVSRNTALMELNCSTTYLSELDVRQNTELTELYCSETQLLELDVSHNAALVVLYCSDTQLSKLDVSQNTALEWLHCNNTQLSELDVSNSPLLDWLFCSDTQLSKLDVSCNTALTELYCSNTQLSELNVSHNTALEVLYCSNTQLSELDVSKNTVLELLYCFDTQLSELSVSNNDVLADLNCSNTNLNQLDVSKNDALKVLDCSNTNLSQLDLSKNDALWVLYCFNTRLSELNVSKNDALEVLYCSGNPIRTLITKTGQLNLPVNTVLGVPGDKDPLSNNNYGYDIANNIVTLTATPVAGKTFVMWKPSSAVAWENGTTQTDKQASFKLIEDITMALWYEYEILSAPATYTGGVDGVTFSVNGELSDYVKTTVNDTDVAATAKAGSTVITLPTSYLKTLQEGSYNVQALYTDGYAKTTLTVKKQVEPTDRQTNPKTGDDSNQLLYLVLCMIAGVAIIGAATYRRNKAR
ncbi:leucine-rich repeat domain-containing protein [Ohessyouella blattaphilus]|uniref:leucine-rich repeat domain-containing protein n=1 Tax=Ohessyouella blattaphilus TaxID=2949333 RepID=UPI003EBEF8BB